MHLNSLFFGLFSSNLLFISVALADAPKFTYLIDAANKITVIDHKAPELSEADAMIVAKIACDAMTRLVKDRDFTLTVQTYMGKDFLRGKTSSRELMNDLARFSDQFRAVEEQQLHKAGLAPIAVGDALWVAASSRGTADMKGVSGETIQRDTTRLQSVACKPRDQLLTGFKSAELAYQAKWIAAGIFGLVLVGVDAAFGLGSDGVLLGVTAASTTLGATVVSKTADALVLTK